MKTIKKRLIVIATIVAMFLVSMTSVASATDISDFKDVPKDAWYYDTVEYAVNMGMVKGTSSTTFDPHSNITTGQFITMLHRMLGNNEIVILDPDKYEIFEYISVGSYYYNAVCWGIKYGLIAGLSSTAFALDFPINRQDAASIIGCSIVNLPNYGFDIHVDDSDTPSPKFTDDRWISSYAKEYVEVARIKGIVNGYEDGTFRPGNSITRAEGTAILVRMMQKIQLD